jgi:hypothetical protein
MATWSYVSIAVEEDVRPSCWAFEARFFAVRGMAEPGAA